MLPSPKSRHAPIGGWLQVHHLGTTPHPAGVAVHLRRVHHQAPVVAPGPAHEPLPQDALDGVVHDSEDVDPRVVGHEVPEEAQAGPREQSLVRLLQGVEVDGLPAVAPVDVAEDVETGLDAPHFPEELGAAEVVVEMVFLPQLLAIWRDREWASGSTRTGGQCVMRMSVSGGTLLNHGCTSSY